MIVVVDYGMGNFGSIVSMIKKAGGKAVLSADKRDIAGAEKLILPGVGSFDNGMNNLRRRGYVDLLTEKVLAERTPILGICLGMQLFATRSEEGTEPGLGWIDAEAIRFAFGPSQGHLKIPYMGWNTITVKRPHPLLPGDETERRFYFVHSYHVRCKDPSNVLATTRYGIEFTSAVAKDNIVGVQFHPEKSHRYGMELMRHFIHDVSRATDEPGKSCEPRSGPASNDLPASEMTHVRVIPCLLLKHTGFVKTRRFGSPVYLGDPVNIIKIFNDMEVDELGILDITATAEKRGPSFDLLSNVANNCFVPLGYGGGIATIEDIRRILGIGYEKVTIGTAALERPDLIEEAAGIVGSQSIVVSVDVKRNPLGKYEVYLHSGKRRTGVDPVTYARRMEQAGAGEILLTAIDRDGTTAGYDTELIRMVSDAVSIPVIASGGAGKVEDFTEAVKAGGASAVAAGSLFVFHGRRRAVLVNFPTRRELEAAL